jgi:hypothetical protein
MSKCPTCPVAGPCYANHPSRSRLCRLVADGREDYRRLVVERSAGVEPPPAHPDAPGWWERMARHARARRCVWREKCGCTSATCAKLGRRVDYDDCAACPHLPAEHAVTIVVAARNCGPWLRECLESATGQTRPCRVVYCDDASTDDSLAVARSVSGVEVIPFSRHRGVCAARNRGLASAATEWVIHLDGDDVLPPDYVAAHLKAADKHPEADILYSGATLFGARSGAIVARDWSEPDLRASNYVHTSAMVRRDAAREAGGWREGIGTAWDWDLWLRVADNGGAGAPVRDVELRYRQHDRNVTGSQGLHDRDNADRMHYLMRVAHSRPAVCVVLSDRLPGLWPRWFARVADEVRAWRDDVRTTPTFEPFGAPVVPAVDLVVLYTGDRWRLRDVHQLADGVREWCGDVSVLAERFIPPPGSRLEQAPAISRFLARAYNRFLDLPNRLLWMVEDDVLPPPGTLSRLARTALGGPDVEPAVSGWYRSRHGDGRPVGNVKRPDGRYEPADPPGPGVHRWQLTGTGCLLAWKPAIGHRFSPFWRDAAAHDFAFTDRLPRPVAVVGEAECRHMIDERHAV